jgi:hypothetical protein
MIVVIAVALGAGVAFGASPAGRPASTGPQASAAKRTKVCRDRLTLRHAPAGVTIGYLYRGDRVIVSLYARRHRWAYVVAARGNGWVLRNGLC